MELSLPKREDPGPHFSCVTKLLRNANGLLIGKASNKLIVDLHRYKVEYAYGKKPAFYVNLVAEKLFAQIYNKVNRT